MPKIKLNVNGKDREVEVADDQPLLWVLRDELNLVGTKFGCGVGQCRACTVQMNGAAVPSCQIPAVSAVGQKIVTIEGLAQNGVLTAVQKAWIEHDVPQCGLCQAGQIMSATALLRDKKNPSDADIDAAMQGNLCRCGTYVRIRAAIKSAAKALNGSAS